MSERHDEVIVEQAVGSGWCRVGRVVLDPSGTRQTPQGAIPAPVLSDITLACWCDNRLFGQADAQATYRWRPAVRRSWAVVVAGMLDRFADCLRMWATGHQPPPPTHHDGRSGPVTNL